MWSPTSVLIVIWGGLLGQWSTEAISTPVRRDEAGQRGMCTTVHRYILRGNTAFIPITLPQNYSILCRVNSSASCCDWLLLTSRGLSYYFIREVKNHLILLHTGLAVIDMSKELEGEFQVLSGANKTCEVRVLLRNMGPWFLCQFFLMAIGVTLLIGLVARMLWDWLLKVRNRLTVSQEEQSTNENIPLVITPA